MIASHILTAVGLLACLIPGPVLSSEPIRTVSWNIEWFPGLRPDASREDKAMHFNAVQPDLVKINPDILLAQEITDQIAMEKLVSAVPGLKVHVMSRFMDEKAGKPGGQQLVIASKLEAHSAWSEAFKPTGNLPDLRRGFAFAALKHPGGGLILVYSVHLKSNGGSDNPGGEENIANTRRESVRQILAHKAEMEKTRFNGETIMGWVIGGDFNTNHDGQFPKCTVIKDFREAGFHNTWDATPKQERLTWRNRPEDTRFSPTTFDYIMTFGFKETQARLIPDISLKRSDHAPVLLMLEAR
jgi:endonuclease/exonuclease/phosphatase family metal-dependent hydrolase